MSSDNYCYVCDKSTCSSPKACFEKNQKELIEEIETVLATGKDYQVYSWFAQICSWIWPTMPGPEEKKEDIIKRWLEEYRLKEYEPDGALHFSGDLW